MRPGAGSEPWYRYLVSWMTSIVTRLADASVDEFDGALRTVFGEIGRVFDVVALGEATDHDHGIMWFDPDQADQAEIEKIIARLRVLGEVEGPTSVHMPNGRTVLAAPTQSAGWSRFTALTLAPGRVPSVDEILALEVLSTVVGTARQRTVAEAELRERGRSQEFLNHLSEQAATLDPSRDTLVSMLEQACDRLGVSAASTLVRDGREFVLVAATDFEGLPAPREGARRDADLALALEAARADHMVWPLDEVAGEIDGTDRTVGEVLVVPHFAADHVAGVVAFVDAAPREWSANEVEFARSVARSIQKLTLRTDVEAQHRRRHQLERLQSEVATIGARTTIEILDDVIFETLRLAIESFDLEGAGIWSFDGDHAVRLAARRRDGEQTHEPLRTPMDAAARARLVEAGHHFAEFGAADTPERLMRDAGTTLTVPIGVEPNGFIAFVSKDKRWSDDEIATAKSLGSLAEQTRVRLQADALVHERLRTEALTSTVAAKAVEATIENVEERLEEILTDVLEHFGVSEASVWRFENGGLRCRAAVRVDGQQTPRGWELPIPDGEPMWERGWGVLRLRDIDLAGHPRIDPETTKLLFVGYGSPTEVHGAIVLTDPLGRRWSDEAISTLGAVGNVIGQLRVRMDYARRLRRQQQVERLLADTSGQFVHATLDDAQGVVHEALEQFRAEFDLAAVTLLELDETTMEIEAPCEVTDDGLPLIQQYLPIDRDSPTVARLLDPSAPLHWGLRELFPSVAADYRSIVLKAVRGRDLLFLVASIRPGREFVPDVEASLLSMTGSLAQLRRRILLERHTRRRAEADQLVGEIARDFVEQPAHDHGRAVDAALARVGRFCGMSDVGQWEIAADGSGRWVQGWHDSAARSGVDVSGEAFTPDHPLARAFARIGGAGVVEFAGGHGVPGVAVGTAILQRFHFEGRKTGGLIGLIRSPRHAIADLSIHVDLLDSVSRLVEQLWRRADADNAVARQLHHEDLLRRFATRLVTADTESQGAPLAAFEELLAGADVDQATVWAFEPNGDSFDCSAVLHVARGDVGQLDPQFASFSLPRARTDPAVAPYFSAVATQWALTDAPEGTREMLRAVAPDGPRQIAFLPAPGSDHNGVGSYLSLSRPGTEPFTTEQLEFFRSAHSILLQHEARVAAERYFGAAFNSAPIGITLREADMRLIHCNAAYCELVGRTAEELWGTTLYDVMPPELARERSEMFADTNDADADDQEPPVHESSYRRPDGTMRWGETRTTPVWLPGRREPLLLTYVEDITERRRNREMLEYQATHDELSGLPNRRALVGEIAVELEREGDCAVLVLDLDRFKVVNDSLGHSVGDQLLITCADRIRLSLRPGDSVCRLGGDEFAILLRAPADAHTAGVVASRLLALLREPVTVGDDEIFPSASIGFAIPQPGDSVEDLLRHADVAMYQAKGQGRDRWEAFDGSMREAVADRIRNESDLRRAVDNDQLEVHYQPEYMLETGEIVGTEALVRWRHPAGGLVDAGSFIGLAEETGLVVNLGRWVLGQATVQGAAWRAAGHDIMTRVNLSARQLRGAVVAEVEEALERAGLPPERLCLELTETAIMDDVQESARILARFRDLGVQVAIDDFGTGFSSLAYLKRFPVDILKVDRTFVDGVGVDPDDTAIVRSIIGLARTLRLDVVAEGIEDAAQAGELVRLGCTRGQGFHLARPAPAAEVSSLLSGLAAPGTE